MLTNGLCPNQNLSKKIRHKILRDFEMKMDPPHQIRKPDLVLINKEKECYHQVNFVVPVDNRVKIKENEKTDKYLDRSRELMNMRVMLISIVIG